MVPALKTFETFLHPEQEPFSLVFSDYTKNQEELKDFYDISLTQAVILAYLISRYPAEISAQKLYELSPEDERTTDSDLKDLTRRKFVTTRIIRFSDEPCFRLTSDALDAFQENRCFGEDVFTNLISEIKNVSLKKIFTKQWRASVNRSLNHPLNAALQKKLEELGYTNLEEETKLAFWLMVYQFVNHFLTPLSYRNGEYVLDGIDYNPATLKYDLGLLVQEGLVQTLPIEPLEDTKDTDRFILAPKAVGALFHGHDDLIRYEEVSKYAEVIKSADIAYKPLFFSNEAQQEMDHLRVLLSVDGFERACRILKEKKRNPAIHSLLWGPPGTGKTEVAKQLARTSGRDIILFDISKVTASAWGATEKFYRALFRAYNYISVISKRVPILLMNEADACLSKRLQIVERSIDKSENAISNILLQAFEDMSGILLATTNLVDNLDPAFDRRFLFKTRLEKPDAQARKHIWLSSIPELNEEEAEHLAEKFEMSGAQINNVVVKRDMAELYYTGDRGYAYIVDLCKKETDIIAGEKRKRIGF